MATVQEIYNEIDRIDNAKSGIAGAIEEKGVEVPAGAKIEEYPGLVRQIQQGDTSDCVKFTPQTLTEEQKAQARENIGAGGGGSSDVVWATYNSTTYQDVLTAYLGGKVVYCIYQDRLYEAGYYIAASSQVRFFSHIGGSTSVIILNASGWSFGGSYTYEQTSNKVSTISGNETNTIKYPNTKAVADALGKMGVISQTQTWTTVPSVNAPGVYAMSNLVMGLIPQANIDLYEAAGATFNTSTGYFELNGLTDISYNEMSAIYAYNVPNPWTGQQGMFTYTDIRTNIPPKNNIATVTAFNGLRLAYGAGQIERIVLKSKADKVQINNLQLAFFRLFYLSDLPDEIDVSKATNFSQAFELCYSLKEIRLYKLKASLTFAACSALSKDSLLYMINNSQTTVFTITLHASVYAKCQSGGEWYSDISTALAAHTNISLASA